MYEKIRMMIEVRTNQEPVSARLNAFVFGAATRGGGGGRDSGAATAAEGVGVRQLSRQRRFQSEREEQRCAPPAHREEVHATSEGLQSPLAGTPGTPRIFRGERFVTRGGHTSHLAIMPSCIYVSTAFTK